MTTAIVHGGFSGGTHFLSFDGSRSPFSVVCLFRYYRQRLRKYELNVVFHGGPSLVILLDEVHLILNPIRAVFLFELSATR